MFEVIWSWFADAYVMRPVNVQSTIKPNFIGTQDQCAKWITAHN